MHVKRLTRCNCLCAPRGFGWVAGLADQSTTRPKTLCYHIHGAAALHSQQAPPHAGIAVATRAEPSFHLLGFMLAVGATCARAFKSILQVSTCAHQSGAAQSARRLSAGLAAIRQIWSAYLQQVELSPMKLCFGGPAVAWRLGLEVQQQPGGERSGSTSQSSVYMAQLVCGLIAGPAPGGR